MQEEFDAITVINGSLIIDAEAGLTSISLANLQSLTGDIIINGKEVQFPTFSKYYVLKGKDEQNIRKLLNSTIIKYHERNPGWTMESKNQYILIYFPEKRLNGAEIRYIYKQHLSWFQDWHKQQLK